MNVKRRILRFGIPTLDRLIGYDSEEQHPQNETFSDPDRCGFVYSQDAGTSFCLIGPHGTGKSVLALHFASRYLADCLRESCENVNVLYVSTDLSYPMAENVWYNFALDTPGLRKIPFVREGKREPGQIVLQRRTPHPGESQEGNLARYLQTRLCSKERSREVTFVDLAAETAGDDWGFVHRLIAVLNEPSPGSPRHLLIVDAVEGLETLVGEMDAFGEKTSRRARIAQMLRTAFKKCHLFFVVEEPAEGERVPEEFVSDAVIRLHSLRQREFNLRLVEVQKVRGQDHVRGRHPYFIRRGVGSFTGDQENPDDPRVAMRPLDEPPEGETLKNHPASKAASPAAEEPVETPQRKHNSRKTQAYVHVVHSLHYMTRNIMLVKGSRPDPCRKLAGFGITHLDGMLGQNELHEQGLPCSTVTALIGDAGTHKSALGKSFLFAGLRPEIYKSPRQRDEERDNQEPVKRVAILLTTTEIDAAGLARQFLRWAWIEAEKQPGEEQKRWFLKDCKSITDFAGSEDAQRPGSLSFTQRMQQLAEENIVCRRLEIHNRTSEGLMHTIREVVAEAQRRIQADATESSDRYKKSWAIRLVIDDFSILRNTYVTLREDSLFLPFLMLHLKREGVSSLIIDTNPGQPDREGPALFSDELRALADNHLYTWRVAFHGESRIAISAIPSLSPDQRSRVRELHWDPNLSLPPTVDRELELYAGLEQRNPRPIPIEVRLYAETDMFAEYITEMNQILGDFFVPVTVGPGRPEPLLVSGMNRNEYAYLHDFCNLQSNHSLDHTLILAVDEFWAIDALPEATNAASVPDALPPPPPLRREREYLEADLDLLVNEPRQLFKGLRNPLPAEDASASVPIDENRSRGSRLSYFRLPGYERAWSFQEAGRERLVDDVDRIPFAWDFGFLMCPGIAWTVAKDQVVHFGNQPSRRVKSIMGGLPSTEGHLHNERVSLKEKKTRRPSWREFLGACQAVTARLGSGNSLSPFDISTVNGEAFSCLILEMWASEIMDRLKKTKLEVAAEFARSVSQKKWVFHEVEGCGLVEWLAREDYVIDLYLAWLLLVDLLPLGELADPQQPTRVLERTASPNAIAARQWYKGACQMLKLRADPEPMQAVGLPGHFSVRGDWFLGVARGSRSDLLADRVLDIFSSRRNNLTRLYSGLGLPTRILGTNDEGSSGRLMTALTWKDTRGEPRTVRYGPLLALGAVESHDFHWFFRSALRNYHKHARIFQRWNSRTILMWHQTKMESAGGWLPGFALYDELLKLGRPTTTDDMNDKLAKAIKNLGRLNADRSDKENSGTIEPAMEKAGETESWTHFEARCRILRDLLVRSDTTGPVRHGSTESTKTQAAVAGK
jgi:KaiC/GvpD/RAD55 family RecA-like ATPase